jgi:hypothetical protein
MARHYRESYFEKTISDRREQFNDSRNPYSRKTFSETLTKKELIELIDDIGELPEEEQE